MSRNVGTRTGIIRMGTDMVVAGKLYLIRKWQIPWFGSKIIDSGWGSKIMVSDPKMAIPGPSKKGSIFDDFHGGGQKTCQNLRGSQKNGQKRGQKSILSLLCKGLGAWGSVNTTWPESGFSISWVMVSKNVKSVQTLSTFYYRFS